MLLRMMSSVLIFSICIGASLAQRTSFFPQAGDGQAGELRLITSLLLLNTSQASEVEVDFLNANGSPMTVDLGQRGVGSSFRLALPKGASVDLRTSGQGELRSGYIRLQAGPGVRGTALFVGIDAASGVALFEAGVPEAQKLSQLGIALDSRASRDTGLAIVNPLENDSIGLTLSLYDSGFQLIGQASRLLAPGERVAQFVWEFFRESDPQTAQRAREMEGVAILRSSRPVAAVTLRQDVGEKAFPDGVATLAAFPVVPGAPQEASSPLAGVPIPSGDCSVGPRFEDAASFSSTLHVSVDGSDSQGDGSPQRPFAGLARAAADAQPGTRIVIHEGVYTETAFIENLQGTEEAPILITSAPGEAAPIFDMEFQRGEAIHLTDARYVIVENLLLRRALSNGINVDDGGSFDTPSKHLVLRNLTVERIGQGGNNDGIKLSGVDAFLVVGCSISDWGGSAIDMVGCHDGVIAYNRIGPASGSSGLQVKGGSERVLILGNRFQDAGARSLNLGGSTGAPFFRPLDAPFEARAIHALANVISGSNAPVAFVSLVDGVFANNTIYRPTRWVLRILNENPDLLEPQGGRFENNIIWFRQSDLSTFANVGPSTRPETFVFRRNLWFAEDDAGFQGPALPVPESQGIVQRDPMLAAPGTDFRLQAASPARSAGIPLDLLEGDRAGNCFSVPPSIGAFEFSAGQPLPPPAVLAKGGKEDPSPDR